MRHRLSFHVVIQRQRGRYTRRIRGRCITAQRARAQKHGCHSQREVGVPTCARAAIWAAPSPRDLCRVRQREWSRREICESAAHVSRLCTMFLAFTAPFLCRSAYPRTCAPLRLVSLYPRSISVARACEDLRADQSPEEALAHTCTWVEVDVGCMDAHGIRFCLLLL